MGRTVINETENKQTIILNDSPEGVEGGYFDSAMEWHDLGGGLTIGEETEIPNILNMFLALENRSASVGEFTLSAALPAEDTEVLDTGLSQVHGLFIADASQSSIVTGTTPENLLFGVVFNPVSNSDFSYAVNRTTILMKVPAQGEDPANGNFLPRCTWKIESGKLIVKASIAGNNNYTPFHSNHKYKWVAW